jgi:hypothetical protein
MQADLFCFVFNGLAAALACIVGINSVSSKEVIIIFFIL